MSVKWITLYIKARRKVYDNLGHKNNSLILTIPILYFDPNWVTVSYHESSR